MQKLTRATVFLLVVFFILIIALFFFQFPADDDFMGTFYSKKFGGTGNGITFYLSERNGRYVTIPLFLLLSSSRVLMEQYYGVVLLLFFLIACLSFYYFVALMLKNHFELSLSALQKALIASIFLMVMLGLTPNVAALIYWVPGTVTYLLPLVMYIWLIASWSLVFHSAQKRWFWTAVVCLLTIMLAGSNEIMLYYACILPFLIGVWLMISGKKIQVQLYVVAVLSIILTIVAFKWPGNITRADHFGSSRSWVSAMGSSLFMIVHVLQKIFFNPLFYIGCMGVILASAYLKPPVVAAFASKRTHWLLEAGAIVGLLFCFDTILRKTTNWSLQVRTVNVIIWVTTFGFWWVLLINAHKIRALFRDSSSLLSALKMMLPGTFAIMLLASPFSWQLLQSIFTAPVHKAVLEERATLLYNARDRGEKVVVVPDYKEKYMERLRQKFGTQYGVVLENFGCPPPLVYFTNEPFDPYKVYYFAEYYGIDTIVNPSGRFPRWGLTNYK